MKRANVAEMSTQDLVARFAQIGVEQDQALLGRSYAKFNRLFVQMSEVSDELKRRPGDERRALRDLYTHPNMQVRLKAAKHTLAVAPNEARVQIESIAASNWFPQAGDAGMTLENLDSGFYKPT
jgi:hypothetical protein